jgi:hypothetical protein
MYCVYITKVVLLGTILNIVSLLAVTGTIRTMPAQTQHQHERLSMYGNAVVARGRDVINIKGAF